MLNQVVSNALTRPGGSITDLLIAVAGALSAAIGGFVLNRAWGTLWLLASIPLLLLSVVLSHIGIERNRLGQRQKARDLAIKKLLETCARAFVSPGEHVRANIMTFTPNGTRLRVNKSTAFNMASDPDCELEIDATAGASGKAVKDRRAAIGDLELVQAEGGPSWGLRSHEQARVRSTLRSILSAPVFDPENVDGPLLGTLQVDSDLTIEDIGFDRHGAAELLQQFADVLSLLMKVEE